MRTVDLTASPLYGKVLRPQSLERLQELTEIITRNPGITLRDDQILEAVSKAL